MLIRTTSRTEVKFPCRTTTRCTNQFPYRKQGQCLRQRLLLMRSGKIAEDIGLGRVQNDQQSRGNTKRKLEGKTVHFATFMDLCHLRSLNWRKSAKSTNKEYVLRADVVKDDSGNNAVFTQQGASATHMAAANILDVTWRWLRCSGQASGAVSVYTQVKMQDATKLLHLSDKDCPTFWIRIPRARRPQQWDSIHDPVLPLERNLYDHPLVGLLWERKIEEVLFEHGQSDMGVPFLHRKLQLFLSVYVDETNNGRNKPRTCRRSGQHCKSKSNWKTQRHYVIKYILDVLNGQHK